MELIKRAVSLTRSADVIAAGYTAEKNVVVVFVAAIALCGVDLDLRPFGMGASLNHSGGSVC